MYTYWYPTESVVAQVLVPADTLSVAGIHADSCDWPEHFARHAQSRVPIQRAAVDLCVPAAAGRKERQEQRESGDGNTEHDGEAEEEGSGKEERRKDGSGVSSLQMHLFS